MNWAESVFAVWVFAILIVVSITGGITGLQLMNRLEARESALDIAQGTLEYDCRSLEHGVYPTIAEMKWVGNVLYRIQANTAKAGSHLYAISVTVSIPAQPTGSEVVLSTLQAVGVAV